MRFSGQTTESKGFATIEDWYLGETGQNLFDELEARISPVLATTFGYYSLQLGCAGLAGALQESCRVKHQFTLGDVGWANHGRATHIQANPSMLPVASDSVDLVILMHHLSNSSEPHAILREVFRVLIPEGKLVIIVLSRGIFIRRNASMTGCGCWVSINIATCASAISRQFRNHA
jgi:SAM-dependent methyltransferase